jgi:hypothetical protein
MAGSLIGADSGLFAGSPGASVAYQYWERKLIWNDTCFWFPQRIDWLEGPR